MGIGGACTSRIMLWYLRTLQHSSALKACPGRRLTSAALEISSVQLKRPQLRQAFSCIVKTSPDEPGPTGSRDVLRNVKGPRKIAFSQATHAGLKTARVHPAVIRSPFQDAVTMQRDCSVQRLEVNGVTHGATRSNV